MSPSFAHVEADVQPLALHLVGRRRRGNFLARGVRERPTFEAAFAPLLAGARVLPLSAVDHLPVVAETLAQLGELVMLGYDQSAHRFVCYAQKPHPTTLVTEASETLRPEGASAHSRERTDAGPAVDSAIAPLEYEAEGSERCTLGSVTTESGAWWSIVLAVPSDAPTGDTLFVRLERHGPIPAGYRGSIDAELSLPASEVDSVVVLLTGAVEQARREGVLVAERRS